jgi:hypothetical protein
MLMGEEDLADLYLCRSLDIVLLWLQKNQYDKQQMMSSTRAPLLSHSLRENLSYFSPLEIILSFPQAMLITVFPSSYRTLEKPVWISTLRPFTCWVFLLQMPIGLF